MTAGAGREVGYLLWPLAGKAGQAHERPLLAHCNEQIMLTNSCNLLALCPPPFHAQGQCASVSLPDTLCACNPGPAEMLSRAVPASMAPFPLPLALQPVGQSSSYTYCMASQIPPACDGVGLHVLKRRHPPTQTNLMSISLKPGGDGGSDPSSQTDIQSCCIFGPLDAPSEGQCSLALRADSSIIILLAEEMLGLGAEERKSWKCAPFRRGGRFFLIPNCPVNHRMNHWSPAFPPDPLLAYRG